MFTLTKTEQILLIKMFKNGFILDQEKTGMDNSHLYKCLGHLSQVGLISIEQNPDCRRENIYKLTDLGVVFTSNISGEKKPKVLYFLEVTAVY